MFAWISIQYAKTMSDLLFISTLQVRSCLDVLWNQSEYQRIWFEHVSHTLHLRCHWSSCQADGLFLSQHHWSEEVPSWHAVTDRNLHRHKHLCSKRSFFFFYIFQKLIHNFYSVRYLWILICPVLLQLQLIIMYFSMFLWHVICFVKLHSITLPGS